MPVHAGCLSEFSQYIHSVQTSDRVGRLSSMFEKQRSRGGWIVGRSPQYVLCRDRHDEQRSIMFMTTTTWKICSKVISLKQCRYFDNVEVKDALRPRPIFGNVEKKDLAAPYPSIPSKPYAESKSLVFDVCLKPCTAASSLFLFFVPVQSPIQRTQRGGERHFYPVSRSRRSCSPALVILYHRLL